MNTLITYIKNYRIFRYFGSIFTEFKVFLNSRSFAILSVLPLLICILAGFTLDFTFSDLSFTQRPLSYWGGTYPIWFMFLILSKGFLTYVSLRYYARNINLSRSQITFILCFISIGIGVALAYAIGTLEFHQRHIESGLSPSPHYFAGMRRVPVETGAIWAIVFATATLITFALGIKKHWASVVATIILFGFMVGGGLNYILSDRTFIGELVIFAPMVACVCLPFFLRYKRKYAHKGKVAKNIERQQKNAELLYKIKTFFPAGLLLY